MKHFSIIMTLAMSLGVPTTSYADGHGNHASAAPKMLKYTEFNQIGNPADVIEVKEEPPKELQPGDVLEVALKPDPTLRGIGDGAGQN